MTTRLPASLILIALCGIATCAATANAENWPGWRGPRGDGTSVEDNIPIKWDGTTGENIHWKVKVPGTGHASPVVWGDTVILATCLSDQESEQKQRMLVCLDRKTGKTRWERPVLSSLLESRHSLNSYASGTPATDGELIYVSFLSVDGRTIPAPNVGTPRAITPGEMVVAAFDFKGNQKWITRPGEFISAHGFCSSPVLYEDLVIVNGDHDGKSYVAALNRSTGKIVWKIPRVHGIRSCVTPIIRDVAGKTQMVFSGSQRVVSLDPRTGSAHWLIEGPTEQFVASMVFDGERFFMACGYPTHHVIAIRPDGTGDVTDTHVVWESKEAKCYVPSPVLAGGYLFVADDRGTANCFNAKTGERVWQDRLGSHFDSSLVAAGGLVYFLGRDGIMRVVEPGPEMKIVAENPLGDSCFASPAISDGQIFVRGEEHLFCIGATTSAAN